MAAYAHKRQWMEERRRVRFASNHLGILSSNDRCNDILRCSSEHVHMVFYTVRCKSGERKRMLMLTHLGCRWRPRRGSTDGRR